MEAPCSLAFRDDFALKTPRRLWLEDITVFSNLLGLFLNDLENSVPNHRFVHGLLNP